MINSVQNNTFSVSEINFHIKDILENAPFFRDIWIEGELRDIKLYQRGNQLYFNLSDENAQLNCVIYSNFLSLIKFTPKNGMKVRVRGRISYFHKRGSLSFQVSYMTEHGIGNQNLAFQKLKDQLEKEGLFSIDRKKIIPDIPETIAVITATNSAALSDFIKIMNKLPHISIHIYPAVMQGSLSALSIIKSLSLVSSANYSYDLVTILRGGGSSEDLSPFNDEALVRVISDYPIPTISAIGHETDFSLLDFVSDKRAATPTDAAQIIITPIMTTKSEIFAKLSYISRALQLELNELKTKLANYQNQAKKELIEKLANVKTQYEQTLKQLELVNPLKKLQQGFSITTLKNSGKQVRSIEEISINDELSTQLKDGKIISLITEIKSSKI